MVYLILQIYPKIYNIGKRFKIQTYKIFFFFPFFFFLTKNYNFFFFFFFFFFFEQGSPIGLL